jgi:Tol biopolymer transport system component
MLARASGAGSVLVAASFACGVLLTAPGSAGAQPSPPSPPGTVVSGRILYLQGPELWQFDLRSSTPGPFLSAGNGQVTSVAISPDRRHLAYSALFLKPTFEVLGTQILVADANGENARVAVQEDSTGPSVTSPAWQADPAKLVFASVLPDGAEVLEEVDLTTGARQQIDAGSAPSVSPDGRWVAYDVPGPPGAAAIAVGSPYTIGWSIWTLDRSNASRSPVVSSNWFVDADVPTFSPDGSTVAFVAVGNGPPQATDFLLDVVRPVARTVITPAEAHGLPDPFDLWSVSPDGSRLHRVAQVQNRQPFLAWSPDGQYLAVWGDAGLQLVDMTQNTFSTVTSQTNSGPIAWTL